MRVSWAILSMRRLRAICALGILAYLGLIVLALCAHKRPGDEGGSNNRLGYPPNMVDQLMMIDSSGGLGGGTFEGTQFIGPDGQVVLANSETRDFPRVGTWTSAEITGDMPFTELIPSFNVSLPPQTGCRLHVRVRSGGKWSPWLYFGTWGRMPTDSRRITNCGAGEVNIDYLSLSSPADAFQARMTLASYDALNNSTPALRRVAISYSGVVEDQDRRKQLQGSVLPADKWAKALEIPFRTQMDAPAALKSQICSPTSTSMVMSYFGVDRPTVENALAIYDSEYDLFGNWNRAVVHAGMAGLDAWVTRFRSWEQVKREIAQGQPVIASIRFRKGEFPSSVLRNGTAGHLIVIRGFTQEGNVIVNDPASRERGNGVVYDAGELAHAWFDHGGVAYIIRKPR